MTLNAPANNWIYGAASSHTTLLLQSATAHKLLLISHRTKGSPEAVQTVGLI